ncbi:MFS transporter [Aneurinibacillus terranovensis]|uniref:MFS transporter n=1 Tax=Aneurinibacillus terranovensis TaxID=278991 RepID=UPI000425F3EA|nr:MFS transporter [Aneurinibacillus terranovensis]
MNHSETLGSNKNQQRWWILANVSLGTFMATLDGSITNVALPTISSSLSVHLYIVQWVITAYLLTIASVLPIIGKLSDLFGRSLLYNVGFLVFTVGSGLCGLSHSIGMLIAMRVVQAIGAAFLMANSQAIVASTFPSTERGRALGITGTMVSLGSMAGPAIGGLLVGFLGWSSIFWINVPIGIVGFLAGLRILPKDKQAKTGEPFDYSGSLLYMAGIVTFLYTVSNSEVWGWGSLPSILGYAVSFIVLVLFYFRERFTKYPMLDFSLYRIQTFRAGSIAALLSFVALFCTNVMMPFYMQDVLNFSPHVIGYVMMAYPLTMALVAPFSGWLSDKIGPLFLTTGGLVINAIGFASLNMLSFEANSWIIAMHLAVFGIGMGMFQSPNNSSVLGAVPRNKLGSAGGLNALVRNIGMVLGTSFSISLFSYQLHKLTGRIAQLKVEGAQHPAAFLTSLHTVFWMAAGVCIVGAFVSASRKALPVRTASNS